jgi:hypothetical protein
MPRPEKLSMTNVVTPSFNRTSSHRLTVDSRPDEPWTRMTAGTRPVDPFGSCRSPVMTAGAPLPTPRRNSWVVMVTLWKAIVPVLPSASVFTGGAVVQAVELVMAKMTVPILLCRSRWRSAWR